MRPELIDRARKLRARGFTYDRIGLELGVNPSVLFYNLNPNARRRRAEYKREYHRRPEVRERRGKYDREYKRRPEVWARIREYRERPEVREKIREYKREYQRRPEVRERGRVSVFEILDALRSPMTIEQISEKLGKRQSAVRRVVEANAGLFEISKGYIGVAKKWKFLRAKGAHPPAQAAEL